MNLILPLVTGLFGKKEPQLRLLRSSLNINEEQFAEWLSGFVDAEGNFQVFIDRHYVRVLFRIVLHIDDIQILYLIKNNLSVGTVRTSGDHCVYSIGKVTDLINNLIPILDKHTLLTTKYFDYLDFKKVVNLLNVSSTSNIQGTELIKVKEILNQMNSGRNNYDYSLIPSLTIKPYWLLGFIEGEGTFGFKNLVPYFQIGQHARNLIVLDNITTFIKSLPKGFNFSNFNTKLELSKTLHKSTNVYVIVLSNIDALHDYFVPFLLSMHFQTRKSIDFIYWCLAIHLHKYGYFYTSEGRSLVLNISKSINTARYSNKPNPVKLIGLDEINKILSIDLPIKLTPEMNHLILSQRFAKLISSRSVWVYDNGKLVTGSPFASYAEAQGSIGISRTSVVVRRNIDTGKLYLQRYSFYSNKQ